LGAGHKGTTTDFYLPGLNISFHLSNDSAVDNLSIPVQKNVPDIVFRRIKEEQK
jgi:hypothetical protein